MCQAEMEIYKRKISRIKVRFKKKERNHVFDQEVRFKKKKSRTRS